jgi:competence ComEA-like helix-hairpin-helix protein
VKQNPPPAKLSTSLFALVLFAIALCAAACATQPRQAQHVSSEVRFDSAAPKADRGSLINLNRASEQELEKLPGVGKVIAERIVAHREQYGPFRRTEHLMMVRGVSDRKFRAIRPLIVVQ